MTCLQDLSEQYRSRTGNRLDEAKSKACRSALKHVTRDMNVCGERRKLRSIRTRNGRHEEDCFLNRFSSYQNKPLVCTHSNHNPTTKCRIREVEEEQSRKKTRSSSNPHELSSPSAFPLPRLFPLPLSTANLLPRPEVPSFRNHRGKQ